MKSAIVAGVVLGILVEVWTYVMGFTGWYKDPKLMALFFLVILIEAVVLVALLRRTAPLHGYAGQIGVGLTAALVASLFIFAGSILFTTVVFPDYFAEIREMGEKVFAAKGFTPEQIRAELAKQAPMQTPVMNAIAGVMGTLLTGLVVCLIAAIPFRRKVETVPFGEA